jgi:RES domain
MVSMAQRRPPEPPADLAGRKLQIDVIPAGAALVRIHRRGRDALFFGRTGGHRFDAPDGAFGVCYLATALEGAFAETCLRASDARFVSRSFLAGRVWSRIPVKRDLRLVALHGSGLARVGATAAVTAGDHAVARRWSASFHAHPAQIDGIAYRANHDNGEVCVALFERCAPHLGVSEPEGLLEDRARLGALLDRYRVGLG